MQEYRFTMTGASLMVSEFVELSKSFEESEFCFDKISDFEIKRDRAATMKRELSELRLRLKHLSKKEISVITATRIENQKLITLLANVRLYRILREFIEEVIWDKIAVFDEQLSYRDFANFIYNKTLMHQEIENLSENTIKKVRQVIFKMLEQAGLIDSIKSKKIQIPFLDFEMQNLLSKADQKYLLNV